MRLRSLKHSQTNRRMPEFSGMVSGFPLSFIYLVEGPLTGMLSMYGWVTYGLEVD
jgi:hypothetical protein